MSVQWGFRCESGQRQRITLGQGRASGLILRSMSVMRMVMRMVARMVRLMVMRMVRLMVMRMVVRVKVRME